MRYRLNLDARWDFVPYRATARWLAGKGEGKGAQVCLPHCWNAAETDLPDMSPRLGWGSYRCVADTSAHPPPPGAIARLRSDGFRGTGDFWLNGRKVARVNGDYLGLDLPLGSDALQGVAILALRLANRCARHVLPGISDPDFHLYGGLAGRVWIEFLPPVHLERESCVVRCAQPLSDGKARLLTGVRNTTNRPAHIEIDWRLSAPDGRCLARESASGTVPAGKFAEFDIPTNLNRPPPWSPDMPTLCPISVALRIDGQTSDVLSWHTGWLEAQFEADRGFVLNGKACQLHGVNRHENMSGFGNALPQALQAEDARRIREMGLNAVRLSHYPQSPTFLDACDHLGLLVYAELASWKSVRGGRWLNAATRQFAAMVRRDRHHPCILLWGLGNEGRHRGAYRRLKNLSDKLDPTRPTIYAENHLHRARRRRTLGITDVWGLNYEFDALEAARRATASGCVVVAECANLPYARRGHTAAERLQIESMRAALEHCAAPGVAGWFLWCYSDYATPRRKRCFRECGVVDAWREPKPAAAWLRARLTDRPVLELWADWSQGAGTRRAVTVVTNCSRLHWESGNIVARPPSGTGLDVYEATFDGQPLRLRGEHPQGTIISELLPWGEAAALRAGFEPLTCSTVTCMEDDRAAPATLTSVPESSYDRLFSARRPDPTTGETVGLCRVRVIDADGTPVCGYEGMLEVKLAPDSLQASLIGGHGVPVRGGQATFWIVAPADATTMTLDLKTHGLPALKAGFAYTLNHGRPTWVSV